MNTEDMVEKYLSKKCPLLNWNVEKLTVYRAAIKYDVEINGKRFGGGTEIETGTLDNNQLDWLIELFAYQIAEGIMRWKNDEHS